MSFHDPISDFLTRLRNAIGRKHRFVDVINSKMIRAIIEVLRGEGFLGSSEVSEDNKTVRVFFRYTKEMDPVLHNLSVISTPGCCFYAKCVDVPYVLGGMGVVVVSTSQGVMTGKEAKKRKIGGKLICSVW